MNLLQIKSRVRSYTRDFTGTIFRENDIVDFSNEAINRIRAIKQLQNMSLLSDNTDEVNLLPEQYHYLIPLYAGSRCFAQDENDNKAGIMMNEFESKLEELIASIEDGSVEIKDENGNVITNDVPLDFVEDIYYSKDNDEEGIVII